MDSAKLLQELEERLPFEKNIYDTTDTYKNFIGRLLEDSKHIALSLRYPYQDYSNIDLPKRYHNWVLRCCEELYNQIGNQGIKSYSENGLSWTRDSGYISNELRSEIEPLVGYIKESDEDDK